MSVQGTVNPLVLTHYVNPASDFMFRLGHVAILVQVHFLFFDDTKQPFCIAFLAGLSDGQCAILIKLAGDLAVASHMYELSYCVP